jgi:hypothetical protein
MSNYYAQETEFSNEVWRVELFLRNCIALFQPYTSEEIRLQTTRLKRILALLDGATGMVWTASMWKAGIFGTAETEDTANCIFLELRVNENCKKLVL